MIDAGERLNPNKEALQFQVSKLDSIDLKNSLVRDLYSIDESSIQPHPSDKLLFGSSFFYNTECIDEGKLNGDCLAYPSFAYGGYSNVWGGATLPYTADDLVGWPLKLEDLEKYYKAVLEFMPLSSQIDSLSSQFPLYTSNFREFKSSQQAQNILRTMRSNQKYLNEIGIYFGKSRLAVRPDMPKNECIYCGQCLSGCPRNLIYNSKDTVEVLKKNPLFTYLGGVHLKNYEETGDYIRLFTINTTTSRKEIIHAKKIFIGCGVISTAKIVFRSRAPFKKIITIKDSQHFMFPGMAHYSEDQRTRNQLHTLSQIFLELDALKPDKKRSHVQIYTYNNLYSTYIERKIGPIFNITEKYIGNFLKKLVVLQGFLHSDFSGEIQIGLSNNGKIALKSIANPVTMKMVLENMRHLFKNRAKIGLTPLYQIMSRIGSPGAGSHFGGTFPMSSLDEEYTTDILGRLSGSKNVHIIDASIFPSIPAGPITFTVMANAYRIATNCNFQK